jgi:hypothetical protein
LRILPPFVIQPLVGGASNCAAENAGAGSMSAGCARAAAEARNSRLPPTG